MREQKSLSSPRLQSVTITLRCIGTEVSWQEQKAEAAYSLPEICKLKKRSAPDHTRAQFCPSCPLRTSPSSGKTPDVAGRRRSAALGPPSSASGAIPSPGPPRASPTSCMSHWGREGHSHCALTWPLRRRGLNARGSVPWVSALTLAGSGRQRAGHRPPVWAEPPQTLRKANSEAAMR